MAKRFFYACAGLLCGVLALSATPDSAIGAPVHVASWNVCSTGGRPFGVAVDNAGDVYVTNQWAGTLEKFRRDGTLGVRLAQSLNYPCGVAVASDGTIYVVEHLGNRVSRLSPDGSILGTFGLMLYHPVFVALDRDGNVYVTDFLNRVVKFSATGDLLSTWGSLGAGPGQLNDPGGVVVADDGFVYVADHGNDRIVKFTHDGEYVASWGSSGAGDGQFSIPHGIASSAGNIYVADNGNARVQVLSSGGSFRDTWGARGSGDGQFGPDGPTDVAVNRFGEVFVVDRANCRIQKFADLAIPTVRRSWASVKAIYR